MGNRIYSFSSINIWDNKRIISKMKATDRLYIITHFLNFVIFLYFAIILIQTNSVDIVNIIISAIGLFASLIVSILSALER